MGGGQSASGDQDNYVGIPVEVGGLAKPGFHEGDHGQQEIVERGKPSVYYKNTGLLNGNQCNGWIWICLQWPCSSTVFLALFGCQLCAPCWFCCLGNACCMNPGQISYIHTLYVIWNTMKNTCLGNFVCGWWLSLSPAVLFSTTLLSTPPKFLFDEDKETPFLMLFKDYVQLKRNTFPPYSGRYRAIDGGGNHYEYTFLGQGGRGYAMNEPFMIYSVLPDAVEMQRALQLRTTFKECPFGQNAIACWFANVAIHDFFRSATGSDKQFTGGVEKPFVNLHSGYLDLQVLYGWKKDIADSIRTWVDGKLKAVAETRFDSARIPESRVIVDLLMMEHNHVCDELKARYPNQFTTDEELYQQARLIMGGVFINLILRMYGDQMFGESAPDGRGFAELRQRNYGCWPACIGDKQDVGNQPTLNFNLIYRWHTSIPVEWDASSRPPSKTKEEIKAIFESNYRWKSGGFGPHNMPDALFMRQVSVPAAAVLTGRACGAPRLNDFRRRFTVAYKSFDDMTGDPAVSAVLQQFYPTVEDVELAVGCQVERSMAGGWSLGQTVGQAILADAFNSIRQDRFYTKDFTPQIYTEWGYKHAQSTILVDLLNRHLDMNLPRSTMIARVPEWAGPPTWRDMVSWPLSQQSFDSRGWPRLSRNAGK